MDLQAEKKLDKCVDTNCSKQNNELRKTSFDNMEERVKWAIEASKCKKKK